MQLTYVLPDSFLQDFSNLRSNYEEVSKVGNLATAKPSSGFFTYLGATDVVRRNQQIEFLECLYNSVKDKLKPNLDFGSQAEALNHVSALRILLAGCLYVKAQIDFTYNYPNGSSSTTLGSLINKMLKLSCDNKNDNVIDEETRAGALLTAGQFLSNRDVFISEPEAGKAKIDEKSWAGFSKYITQETALLSKEYSDYPCRDFMMPVCSTVMKLAGGATGFVLGDALGKSSAMLSTRSALTAALSSGVICLMGPGAQMGVIVLIPTIAGRILDTFCGLSLGYVLGVSMGLAGSGIGWGVGMGMDLGVKLLKMGCHGLANCYYGEGHMPNITGITLVNSNRVIGGVTYEAEANYEQCELIFTETPEGMKFRFGTQEGLVPWDFMQMTEMKDPFMQKLQQAMQPDMSGQQMPKIEQSERSFVLLEDDEEERAFAF